MGYVLPSPMMGVSAKLENGLLSPLTPLKSSRVLRLMVGSGDGTPKSSVLIIMEQSRCTPELPRISAA